MKVKERNMVTNVQRAKRRVSSQPMPSSVIFVVQIGGKPKDAVIVITKVFLKEWLLWNRGNLSNLHQRLNQLMLLSFHSIFSFLISHRPIPARTTLSYCRSKNLKHLCPPRNRKLLLFLSRRGVIVLHFLRDMGRRVMDYRSYTFLHRGK